MMKSRGHAMDASPILESVLTCPHCGFGTVEMMPTNACVIFHECPGCRAVLRPKAGDCCVFCSYGSVKCPPVQEARGCCAVSDAAESRNPRRHHGGRTDNCRHRPDSSRKLPGLAQGETQERSGSTSRRSFAGQRTDCPTCIPH